MNIAFTALTLISLIILTAVSPSTAFPTMIEGVRNAILLIMKLTAIYAVWLSVLKMMQATGLDQKLSNGLKPFIKKLFKNESDEAYKWISVNLASNMLGMGGATTPAGIKAMNAMCRVEGKATDNMLLLLVINATSIQLIPATVIALRATAGSADAASIFLPTLIATFCSTFIGTVLCKLFSKREKSEESQVSPAAPVADMRNFAKENGLFSIKEKLKLDRADKKPKAPKQRFKQAKQSDKSTICANKVTNTKSVGKGL